MGHRLKSTYLLTFQRYTGRGLLSIGLQKMQCPRKKLNLICPNLLNTVPIQWNVQYDLKYWVQQGTNFMTSHHDETLYSILCKAVPIYHFTIRWEVNEVLKNIKKTKNMLFCWPVGSTHSHWPPPLFQRRARLSQAKPRWGELGQAKSKRSHPWRNRGTEESQGEAKMGAMLELETNQAVPCWAGHTMPCHAKPSPPCLVMQCCCREAKMQAKQWQTKGIWTCNSKLCGAVKNR